MAGATTSAASSIEISSIASTVGRRDLGFGSVEIGYDEERAEPNSSACVARKSNWRASNYNR